MGLTKDNVADVKYFLNALKVLFDSLGALTHSDRTGIIDLTVRAEWKSLEKYYDNIIFRLYKSIIQQKDLDGATKMISLALALRNTPKALKRFNDYEAKAEEDNAAGGFSQTLKETGEEFI